jgi:hypothetical protein
LTRPPVIDLSAARDVGAAGKLRFDGLYALGAGAA